jgi:hypothetical protein
MKYALLGALILALGSHQASALAQEEVSVKCPDPSEIQFKSLQRELYSYFVGEEDSPNRWEKKDAVNLYQPPENFSISSGGLNGFEEKGEFWVHSCLYKLTPLKGDEHHIELIVPSIYEKCRAKSAFQEMMTCVKG